MDYQTWPCVNRRTTETPTRGKLFILHYGWYSFVHGVKYLGNIFHRIFKID